MAGEGLKFMLHNKRTERDGKMQKDRMKIVTRGDNVEAGRPSTKDRYDTSLCAGGRGLVLGGPFELS